MTAHPDNRQTAKRWQVKEDATTENNSEQRRLYERRNAKKEKISRKYSFATGKSTSGLCSHSQFSTNGVSFEFNCWFYSLLMLATPSDNTLQLSAALAVLFYLLVVFGRRHSLFFDLSLLSSFVFAYISLWYLCLSLYAIGLKYSCISCILLSSLNHLNIVYFAGQKNTVISTVTTERYLKYFSNIFYLTRTQLSFWA